MRSVYITSFIIVSTLIGWLSVVGISQYLSGEPARRHHSDTHAARAGNGEHAHSHDSPSLSVLEKEYEENPSSLTTSVNFANALFEDGMTRGNAENLKRAVGLFHEVLELDSAHPDALLGLGTLSLHVGVPDKAVEYYTQYIAVRPDDLAISANLALAEARSGDVDSATDRLDAILDKNPDFVIAMVTKGLILADSGETEKARELWLKAERLESSEVLKQRISSLIVDSLRKTDTVHSDAPVASSGASASEASMGKYFENHEIVGPKIHDMSSQSPGRFVVYVRDFPVSAMPPVAREVFEKKVKEQLSQTDFSEVAIVDAVSREELLLITGSSM
jgi:tetratricopeptide (TPR) repeat protein